MAALRTCCAENFEEDLRNFERDLMCFEKQPENFETLLLNGTILQRQGGLA